MTSDPKKDVHQRTDTDPHGRDHSEGLAGAKDREEVHADERFANSREEGVVDKHNYLDDLGDAVASTLGTVAGAETGDAADEKRRDRDRKPSS